MAAYPPPQHSQVQLQEVALPERASRSVTQQDLSIHFNLSIATIVFSAILLLNEIVGYIMRAYMLVHFAWNIGIWATIVCGFAGVMGIVCSKAATPSKVNWQVLFIAVICSIIASAIGIIGGIVEVIQVQSNFWFRYNTRNFVYGNVKAFIDLVICVALCITSVINIVKTLKSYGLIAHPNVGRSQPMQQQQVITVTQYQPQPQPQPQHQMYMQQQPYQTQPQLPPPVLPSYSEATGETAKQNIYT